MTGVKHTCHLSTGGRKQDSKVKVSMGYIVGPWKRKGRKEKRRGRKSEEGKEHRRESRKRKRKRKERKL